MRKVKRRRGLVAIVVMALVIGGCTAAQGVKPSQVTTALFLQQLKSKQGAGAYQLLNKYCQTTVTQQQMQNYWDLVERNRGAVQSWSQTGVRVSSFNGKSTVQLQYALQCEKGQSSVQFNLAPDGEKWLIEGFNFAG